LYFSIPPGHGVVGGNFFFYLWHKSFIYSDAVTAETNTNDIPVRGQKRIGEIPMIPTTGYLSSFLSFLYQAINRELG
jgi:hypothetical protein